MAAHRLAHPPPVLSPRLRPRGHCVPGLRCPWVLECRCPLARLYRVPPLRRLLPPLRRLLPPLRRLLPLVLRCRWALRPLAVCRLPRLIRWSLSGWPLSRGLICSAVCKPLTPAVVSQPVHFLLHSQYVRSLAESPSTCIRMAVW